MFGIVGHTVLVLEQHLVVVLWGLVVALVCWLCLPSLDVCNSNLVVHLNFGRLVLWAQYLEIEFRFHLR